LSSVAHNVLKSQESNTNLIIHWRPPITTKRSVFNLFRKIKRIWRNRRRTTQCERV